MNEVINLISQYTQGIAPVSSVQVTNGTVALSFLPSATEEEIAAANHAKDVIIEKYGDLLAEVIAAVELEIGAAQPQHPGIAAAFTQHQD